MRARAGEGGDGGPRHCTGLEIPGVLHFEACHLMLRYQDAYLPDSIEPGERDCAERWQLIAPHVPSSGILLDVGSNLGYYGLRAITEHPDIAVISLEADASIADRQREIVEAHRTDRLCLLHGRIDSHLARSWVRTCDWIELTLLLAVLHWVDDPASVLRDLSSMSGAVIAEVPDVGDTGACGRKKVRLWGDDPVAWFRSVTGRDVVSLGRVTRHTSATPSHLLLVRGPVARRPTRPYWDAVFPHPQANDYHLEFDGSSVRLSIRGRAVDWRPGINLVSLMKLGRLIHPEAAVLRAMGEHGLMAAPRHGDPFPHNMLWSSRGVDLIDADDQSTGADQVIAMAALDRSLEAWARGATTSRDGYIRGLLGSAAYVRRRLGRILRRLTSDDLVERLKIRFGL